MGEAEWEVGRCRWLCTLVKAILVELWQNQNSYSGLVLLNHCSSMEIR